MVVNYIYDAWGNHAIVDSNGADVTSGIGLLNPFRYRGYYYDTETGLYYLQTRYYDPELGRFISQDSVDYADPEKINGLNLYAYCGNNPVMGYDPTGTTEWWEWLLAVLGIVVLAVAAVGLTVVSGGTASPTLALVANWGATILCGMAAGATVSVITQSTTGNLDWEQYGIDILVGGVSAVIAEGTGQIFSSIGHSTGMYLNQMVVKGLSVGKVFNNFIIPETFSVIGSFIGGVVGGTFVDKYINKFFGKESSIQHRLLNYLHGEFWSTILDFISGIL